MSKVATLPMPPGGFGPFPSGGHNLRWPTSGQGGYITPPASRVPGASGPGQNQKWPTSAQGGYINLAASRVPAASGRVAESEVAHM